ncbi:hypothetical protein METHB2_210027 [Candidatus Methylobacter favarea]|uniref:Uncharacterized protein n=1 Tax=Candidatus Methylobacter favarea TaxID=2707345 RepID=A0A8S0WZU5_9GAMM|nr:hypothetical protein METHB2_210027 [Candidatus Methylobacter favarea]
MKSKIEKFIRYVNETMAKPFRWTYQAKPLAQQDHYLRFSELVAR